MKLLLKRHEHFCVPLKDLVVFPRMVVPFFVGRRRSVRSVEEAARLGRPLFLVTQKKTAVEEPGEHDVHAVGTIARVLQMMKLPDGKIRLLVEGTERAAVGRYTETKECLRAIVRPFKETVIVTPRVSALMRTALSQFTQYNEIAKKVTPDAVTAVEAADSPDSLVDLIAGHLPLKIDQKLEILSMEDTAARLERCAAIVASEIELLSLEQEITGKVRRKLEKTQKDYFLNEQLKEIQKELGADGEDPTGARELEEKIKAKGLPAEVAEKCQKELKRLSRMQPMSPESALLRTYLEWIVDLPWTDGTPDNRDIEHARAVLDEDHYDLKKVKERILDFIAVRQLKSRVKGPILCFIGPPGTGKTSLGRSVARSLGRSFVRVSLGGVRDEAEIRGHRKTYVGALPGKILQSMRKAGSRNPVFLLDEIDKMSSDWRGDPASALLEVLDPEQNNTFMDHYLEVPYDLSDVMFITTANSVHNIPYPLRDRMEVIEISGYTEFEKENIAEKFLVRKQIQENGLEWADITFQKSAIMRLIRGYTLEAGVRNLEREIANILRKIARDAIKEGKAPSPDVTAPAASADSAGAPAAAASPAAAVADPAVPSDGAVADGGAADGGPAAAAVPSASVPDLLPTDGTAPVPAAAVPLAEPYRVVVTSRSVEKYLGKERFQENAFSTDMKPGLAYGLAWTELGGQLLAVEVAVVAGKGELTLTGSLGDVMKESAHAALTFLRAHHETLGISASFLKDRDIHVHVPEGAIPKDGPSAGITLTAALLSAVTQAPVTPGFAMTGEITLTGRLLPIGGVKEKVLAAHRYKMTHVLLPRRNEKDLEEIPAEVQQAVSFHFADSVLEALSILFPQRSFQKPQDSPAAAAPAPSPRAPVPPTDPLHADLPQEQPAHEHPMAAILQVRELSRKFGELTAVDGVTFDLQEGEIFSLLGPNGAGKTTTISMLCTLFPPTSGTATIAGHSVTDARMAVRRVIGVVPQELALYDELSGRENLAFWGRMYGMKGAALRTRIDEVLQLIGLAERAGDRVKTYSGGMKRRVNIGVGLLHKPRLLFLDEPTVGIDPQSRRAILDAVKDLNRQGMSVLYTTHYMEEAEELSNRVGIIDHGKLIALGTQEELTRQVGHDDTLVLHVDDEHAAGSLTAAISGLKGATRVHASGATVVAVTPSAEELLAGAVSAANHVGTKIRSIDIQEPNLESVFLQLTGRALRD